MAINISRYVDVTSGVGGGATVRQRDLVARLFTTNPRVPVDGVVELESEGDALTYFGSTSPEYARAQFYFGWVSKNVTRPRKLQFARFPDVAVAPRIYGARAATLATLKAFTAGTLTITAGANTANLTGLNFSAATSLAAVATTLQAALRAATGAQFTTSTVTFDATRSSFDFVGVSAVDAPMSVTVTGTAQDVAAALGWASGAIMSPGVTARTIPATLETNAEISTNFGSFAFVQALTQEQVIQAAQWNAARNVEFMYSARVTDADRVALSAALMTTSGVTLTYCPDAAQFDEMCPMIVMAATDYTRRASVQNYMFQSFGALTPKVSTSAMASELDAARINYYGVTQTAGQMIAFYQRGVMGGGPTDPTDQNVYANEVWLKDAARANIMTLLLSVGRVPANKAGEAQVIAVLQDAIDRARTNGVVSVEKALTVTQRLYVSELTGDELAWHQVQGAGFWVSAEMQAVGTTDGRTEYKCVYTLIYSKDDAIRKVEGSHVLI